MARALRLVGATVAVGASSLLFGCATGSADDGLAGGVGGASSGASSSSGVLTGTTSSSSSASSSSSSSASSSSGVPPSGLPLGATCTSGTDCQSGLCKPVVLDTPPVCVTPCTSQADCGTSTTFFCEPVTAGSTNGYCIPQSPAHCLSCMQDSDCGSLSEVCFQAPGDNALACNVDCSLAGQSACPPDYSCMAETVAGMPRMLCRPTSVPDCLDALGGYCDRLTAPQACARTNTAGTCIGQRVCMSNDQRFDTCDATAPQCKTDCSDQDPAGCMETFCSSATSAVADCGTCGNVCPGDGATADNVTCNSAQMCTFSCQGENYDVNDDPADGCEVADSPQGNHTLSPPSPPQSALNVSDCDSGDMDFNIKGLMPSDTRVHEDPSIVGFDATTGSAPDFLYIYGVGHTFCENNIVMQLCVTGSSSPSCYSLSVTTDNGNTYFCQTNGTGCCPPLSCDSYGPMGICGDSSGQFDDNTIITMEVQKTCGTSVTESVSYEVYGHL